MLRQSTLGMHCEFERCTHLRYGPHRDILTRNYVKCSAPFIWDDNRIGNTLSYSPFSTCAAAPLAGTLRVCPCLNPIVFSGLPSSLTQYGISSISYTPATLVFQPVGVNLCPDDVQAQLQTFLDTFATTISLAATSKLTATVVATPAAAAQCPMTPGTAPTGVLTNIKPVVVLPAAGSAAKRMLASLAASYSGGRNHLRGLQVGPAGVGCSYPRS